MPATDTPPDHTATAAEGQPAAGRVLGEIIGAGAIATVVRVTNPGGPDLAGKMLHASHGRDEAAVRRFAQEAALLRSVVAPNVVAIHGVERIADHDVLLMELVEGPTLAEVIATEAPMREDRLIALATGIAAGLAAAHAAGVIHRDLKPANVLVAGARTPKLSDFGMARATSFAGVDRQAFTVLGTPDYMAPESVDPRAVDPRSDLYALGIIMFEMASGRVPFSGATPFAVLDAHRRSPVPDIDPGYSAPLRVLTRSLLAKSPGDRPPAAAAVVEALGRIGAGDTAALVPLGDAAGRCTACGTALVDGVGVCMGCGLAIAQLEAGDHTLLVTGPGEPGDKLDSELRQRLRRWIADNPALGVVSAPALERKIPRVPFTLLSGVSEPSGQAIASALERIGLLASVVHGGPMRSPAMRKKTLKLVQRAALIGVTSMAGLWQSMYAASAAAVAFAVLAVVMTVRSKAAVTRSSGRGTKALPEPIRPAVRTLERVIPGIARARHRHGLRGVVRRALALSRRIETGDAETDHALHVELSEAIERAAAAAGRLDTLDRELEDLRRDDASHQARQRLHERDTWAARLLQLTASLDALHARIASSEARGRAVKDTEALDELRAHVEALEEVEIG